MNHPASPGEQAQYAYRVMAYHAQYRPQAPSDGYGTITAPPEELDLNNEAFVFAVDWLLREEQSIHNLGYPDSEVREAFIYTVEAARCIAGQNPDTAKKLLTLARTALEALPGTPKMVSYPQAKTHDTFKPESVMLSPTKKGVPSSHDTFTPKNDTL